MIERLGRPITLLCLALVALNVVLAGYYRALDRHLDATWCILGAVVLAASMMLVEMLFGSPPGGDRG